MASDREAAKGAVVKKETDDPELTSTLESAAKHQLDLKKEDNRHAETMNRQNLGFFGKAFGGEKSAPTYIAAVMAILGAIGAGYTIYKGSTIETAAQDYWSTQTEKLIAFTLASMTFIFGRGFSK